MKKSARTDANTALAVVRRSQKFSPRRRPRYRGAGRPKFNQLEMVTTFTYSLQTQFGEDRCTQFRVIVVTDQQTNNTRPPARPPVANTQTGPITIHSATKLSAQCNQRVHPIFSTLDGICNVPEKVIRILHLHLLQFGKTQKD